MFKNIRYKNYLENSVYDHSQNTKTRYLKFFWLIVISFSLIFSILILLFKKIFFKFLLNLPQNFSEEISEISQIFEIYDFIIKFYSIFIFFDSFGIAFQEIVKTFNDHSRNYLNFYKGISLVFVFFPIGIITANFLCWELVWGFWIGIYSQMICYTVILMIVTYRNYYTSTFQISYWDDFLRLLSLLHLLFVCLLISFLLFLVVIWLCLLIQY